MTAKGQVTVCVEFSPTISRGRTRHSCLWALKGGRHPAIRRLLHLGDEHTEGGEPDFVEGDGFVSGVG